MLEQVEMKDNVKLTEDVGTKISSSVKLKRRRTLSFKRQNKYVGCFMNDNARPIDFVLVYANEEDDSSSSSSSKPRGTFDSRRKYFQENLIKEGCEIETEIVKSGEDDLTFVKIHVPFTLMSRRAESLKIKMPLWVHDEPINKFADDDEERMTFGQKLKTFLCCRDKKSEQFDPDTIIVWPFEKRHITQYAIIDKDRFFTNRQRIEIVWEVLQQTPNDPTDTKKRGIESLLEHGVYESAYPLHDGDPDSSKSAPSKRLTLRQRLKREWANWGCIIKPQPLHDIRNYFGEKIGFYFAFMDFYVKSLIVPSIMGLIVFTFGLIQTAMSPEVSNICHEPEGDPHSEENNYNVADYWMCPICAPPHCEPSKMAEEFCGQYLWSWRLDNEGSLTLSCATCLWAILFLKFWRRREATLACAWDTYDSEEFDSVIRPGYEERAVRTRKNPVTLETEPFIPTKKLALWFCLSSLATLSLLVLATCGLAGLVMSRIALYGGFKQVGGYIGSKNVEFSRWTIHGCIFIMVSLFEKFYHSLAHRLTSFECPKTDTEFMSSLLWKIFIFELLNDFVPLAYAAWLKGKTVKTPLDLNFYSELCDGGCLGEVTELVAVLLIARLVVGNLAEIGLPLIGRFCKRIRNKNKTEDADVATMPQWQADFHLEEAELDGVYDEYMEMMVQFAFIVLFIPALPVAAALCFLNNVAEIRVDAFNMMFANRRPLPIRVAGIQIWNQFLDIIVKLGVIVNAALISFTSDNFVYFYYVYSVNPGSDGIGYTKFLLASIDVDGWHHEDIEEMKHHNITKCFYSGFRQSYPPYQRKNFYWQIFTLRVAVFAGYCLLFFIIMWFINTFIDSVPENVKTKIKRRHYVVHKAREAEAAVHHTKWAEKLEKSEMD